MSTQLLIGGRFYSSSSPDATAMAVTDGTVVFLGAEAPGRAMHPDAEIIDLDGAFVAPAFVDPHVHVTALGLRLTGLDLTDSASLADALAALRAYASTHPDGVIIGEGWDNTRWPEHRPPTVAELDEAAGPGRLVYLARVDAHSAVASSALLAAAGVAGTSGPVTADAHHRVRRVALDSLTPAQRATARTAALDHAASKGIVAVHENAGPDISGRADLAELLAFDHGVAVRTYWGQAVRTADEARALIAELGVDALGGDLFVDGSLGSHTALLRDPYVDAATTGTSYLDVDAITDHLRACTQAGIQAGFHAIGDAAIDRVVAAFTRVADELGGPAVASLGHRVEHAEMVDQNAIDTFARLGVIASVQPGFDAEWGGGDGMYAARLGTERAATLNPFAAMAAAGVSLAIGSDAPVTSLDPWAAIQAAVHHRTSGHGLSPRAAFAAATRGAWRAGGVRDGLAGTLVPGAPASYTVWDAGDLVVAAAADTVQRWSTDPRSRVPGLPVLDPGAKLPTALRTVRDGVTICRA
ncbi:amidohydrolase [Nocardia camponoti]|uniref:Amidohydrolase n=1 Tax=Nocardia camponoti TaxID=1616106 RepID=A0A917Q9A7_9NOCA|nr:amidohydrolase family protein [Nocardia camponoti]GGK36831.1 amidohydrolase [Nocardia camponoti]